MPPRTPEQPDHLMDRFRARLTEEMDNQGYTDRTLAAKLTDDGLPIGHTAIFKTRKGTRQPSIDECAWIAHTLGFPSIETFVEGPATARVQRALGRVQHAVDTLGMEQRNTIHSALMALSYALEDQSAVAVLDEKHPGWREQYYNGLLYDIRWAIRDQMALWGETVKRLDEVFHGVQMPTQQEVDDLAADLRRATRRPGDAAAQ